MEKLWNGTSITVNSKTIVIRAAISCLACDIEHEYGARYSLYYELPYYNAISFCILDPMHCLILGISKTFLKVWISHDLISDQQFSLIQSRVNLMKCPPDIGRIPYKIISKFDGLKADQWKSWTLYFSLFCLKDICLNIILSVGNFCICYQVVEEKLLEAEKLVEEFCTKFEELYG